MPTGEVGHDSQLLLSIGMDDSLWTIKDANRMNCHFKLSLQYNVLPIAGQFEVTSLSLVCLIIQKELSYYQFQYA